MPTTPPLRGQTVFITGASSGLGRALAVALSRGGNNLVVTARRQPLLDALAAEVEANGSRCLPIAYDATDARASQAAVDAALARFGRIDVAILNAGGAPHPAAMGSAEQTVDAVIHTMRLNYDTLVHHLVPLIAVMRDAGGTIAWTGSPSGYFGLPKSGPYSAAKAAGRILLDTCRIELADTPLRVVALYPGFTYTEGLAVDEVPFPALIIEKERAVREMLWAIAHGRSHYMFPRRIRWPVQLARCLPEPVRRWVLARFARQG
jgi:NAD(P)-dependent dehydrogenase (short-subunit alcohol dehydrogenase family)